MTSASISVRALVALVAAVPIRAQSAAVLSRHIQYYNPDWSPDGRSIVFESTLGGKFGVYTIGADGTKLTLLTPDTANSEQPRWSPDGKRIVFSSDRAGHSDLYAMNADGSHQLRLTTTPGGGYYNSSFSRDGKWILFQGRPDNRETQDRAYVVASSGGSMRQLTDSSYAAEGPRWNTDGTITFLQVRYPKRYWSEMLDADRAQARASERLMTIRADGSGLAPSKNQEQADAKHTSPNGKWLAYEKVVDGWSGIYVADVATHTEHLLTGGPGAGPFGYLRTASLTTRSDTIDTYESPRGGFGDQIRSGNGAYVVRTQRPLGGRRWELMTTWFDSSGRVTTRQGTITTPGSLATAVGTVRANADSASFMVAGDRITGWVVPSGKPPQLFDGPSGGDRFTSTAVDAAIATAKPAVGAVFLATTSSLYGGHPLDLGVDSIRVVRRDTLYRESTPIVALVLRRGSGGETWVEESTGAELMTRGNAGPERWWWHIRRGIAPPPK